jgi:glycosyltransferase involved in cell wall biosynthesis
MDKTIYYLSRTQAGAGHAVRVFSITDKPAIEIPGVTVSTYMPRQPSRLLFTRRLHDLLCWRSPFNLPKALIADVLAWQPDVVHMHGVHALQHLVLGSCMERAAIPYCISVHGMLALAARQRHRFTKSIAGLWERPHVNRAAFLHALTEEEARDLRSYGASAPVVIAPNGIDIADPLFANRTTTTAPDGALTFLFLGRLDPEQKGLDMLLEAWKRAALGEHARLILVGPSWRGGQMRLDVLAKRLGIESGIEFTGPAAGAHKIDLLRCASVFVLPSRWEGLSFAVLEAAALAKPCLLTVPSDPLGRFAAADAAVIVEPTQAAIAAGLQRYAEMNPADRSAMGERGRRLVEDEFTWPPVARTLVAAYRTAAAQRKPLTPA